MRVYIGSGLRVYIGPGLKAYISPALKAYISPGLKTHIFPILGMPQVPPLPQSPLISEFVTKPGSFLDSFTKQVDRVEAGSSETVQPNNEQRRNSKSTRK